jgi:hypothetical protein
VRRIVAWIAGLAVLVILASVRADADVTWATVHDGYGAVGVETTDAGEQVRFLAPASAERSEHTHAALQATTRSYGDLELTARMRTVRQLRRNDAPNPWEAAWLAWHYRDDEHFYYLVLKPNGWELGKRDPAYPGGQRFLASGDTPTFDISAWQQVRVVQVGSRMAVWANGRRLVTYTDPSSPYRDGRVAIYVEDAHAQFADITVGPAGIIDLTR